MFASCGSAVEIPTELQSSFHFCSPSNVNQATFELGPTAGLVFSISVPVWTLFATATWRKKLQQMNVDPIGKSTKRFMKLWGGFGPKRSDSQHFTQGHRDPY